MNNNVVLRNIFFGSALSLGLLSNPISAFANSTIPNLNKNLEPLCVSSGNQYYNGSVEDRFDQDDYLVYRAAEVLDSMSSKLSAKGEDVFGCLSKRHGISDGEIPATNLTDAGQYYVTSNKDFANLMDKIGNYISSSNLDNEVKVGLLRKLIILQRQAVEDHKTALNAEREFSNNIDLMKLFRTIQRDFLIESPEARRQFINFYNERYSQEVDKISSFDFNNLDHRNTLLDLIQINFYNGLENGSDEYIAFLQRHTTPLEALERINVGVDSISLYPGYSVQDIEKFAFEQFSKGFFYMSSDKKISNKYARALLDLHLAKHKVAPSMSLKSNYSNLDYNGTLYMRFLWEMNKAGILIDSINFATGVDITSIDYQEDGSKSFDGFLIKVVDEFY